MANENDQTTMIKIHNTLLLLAEILLVLLKIIYYICKSVYRLIVPMEKKNVTGEIVLITGAGHGIGKELAIKYASLGATVVCWDINEETNNETMNDIKRMGRDSVYAYRCDVSNREDVFRVAEKVKKEVGDVTILVNNAGVLVVKSLMNQSFNEITRVININVMAQYWTLKAFLPNMIEKNYGHVVALSSLTAYFVGPYGTVYCTSKSAVKTLMECLSEELRVLSNGKSSIQLTTIYLNYVRTGFVKKPKIRFPRILRELSPQKVASSIIDAQRRNYKHKALPACLPFFSDLFRFLPTEVYQCVADFIGTGAEPDD